MDTSPTTPAPDALALFTAPDVVEGERVVSVPEGWPTALSVTQKWEAAKSFFEDSSGNNSATPHGFLKELQWGELLGENNRTWTPSEQAMLAKRQMLTDGWRVPSYPYLNVSLQRLESDFAANMPDVTVEAVGADDALRAHFMRLILRKYLDNAGWTEKNRLANRRQMRGGVVFYRMYWDHTERNGPYGTDDGALKIDLHRLGEVFYDPLASADVWDLSDARYVGVRRFPPLAEMKRLYPEYADDFKPAAAPDAETGSGTFVSHERRAQTAGTSEPLVEYIYLEERVETLEPEIIGYEQRPELAPDGTLGLVDNPAAPIYGPERKVVRFLVTVMVGGVVVEHAERQDNHGYYSLVPAWCERNADGTVSSIPLRCREPMQELAKALARKSEFLATMPAPGGGFYDRSAFGEADPKTALATRQAGGWVPIDARRGGVQPNEAYGGQVFAEILGLIESYKRTIDDLSGVSAIAAGRQTGAEQNASYVELMTQNQAMNSLAFRANQLQAMARAAQIATALLSQYVTLPVVVRITGDEREVMELIEQDRATGAKSPYLARQTGPGGAVVEIPEPATFFGDTRFDLKVLPAPYTPQQRKEEYGRMLETMKVVSSVDPGAAASMLEEMVWMTDAPHKARIIARLKADRERREEMERREMAVKEQQAQAQMQLAHATAAKSLADTQGGVQGAAAGGAQGAPEMPDMADPAQLQQALQENPDLAPQFMAAAQSAQQGASQGGR